MPTVFAGTQSKQTDSAAFPFRSSRRAGCRAGPAVDTCRPAPLATRQTETARAGMESDKPKEASSHESRRDTHSPASACLQPAAALSLSPPLYRDSRRPSISGTLSLLAQNSRFAATRGQDGPDTGRHRLLSVVSGRAAGTCCEGGEDDDRISGSGPLDSPPDPCPSLDANRVVSEDARVSALSLSRLRVINPDDDLLLACGQDGRRWRCGCSAERERVN
ncbi:hypothetical protein CDD83_8824 [Cordyceps sp. RAO-2017]|nr:hypothetical protein CDD83_8824 [Cordyceps sp. RAO-2017]